MSLGIMWHMKSHELKPYDYTIYKFRSWRVMNEAWVIEISKAKEV